MRSTRIFWRHILITASSLFITTTSAQAGGVYGKWKYDKDHHRYVCRYTYSIEAGGTGMYTVYWYTDKDEPRYGWFYFTDDKHKLWGRAAGPGNPIYDAGKLRWQWYNAEDRAFADFPGDVHRPIPPGATDPIAGVPALPVKK